MSKGTPSMGRKSGKKTHILCRRCNSHSYHIRKKKCARCGFGASSTIRHYTWHTKTNLGKRMK